MTRPLKFRAWDTKQKQMLTGWDSRLAIDMGGLPFFKDDQTVEMRQYVQDTFIIEQFTGLQDKNGQDLYEGDILNEKHDKAHPDGGHIAGTYAFHPENAMAIEWSEAAGCFVVDHGAKSLAKELAWRKQWGGLVRIGNIHQNPELLKP